MYAAVCAQSFTDGASLCLSPTCSPVAIAMAPDSQGAPERATAPVDREAVTATGPLADEKVTKEAVLQQLDQQKLIFNHAGVVLEAADGYARRYDEQSEAREDTEDDRVVAHRAPALWRSRRQCAERPRGP